MASKRRKSGFAEKPGAVGKRMNRDAILWSVFLGIAIPIATGTIAAQTNLVPKLMASQQDVLQLALVAIAGEIIWRGIARKHIGDAAQIALDCIAAPILVGAGGLEFLAVALLSYVRATAATILCSKYGFANALLFRITTIAVVLLAAISPQLATAALILALGPALARLHSPKASIANELKLNLSNPKASAIEGVKLFVKLYAVLLTVGLVLKFTGLNDSEKVISFVAGQTPAFMLMAIVLAPIGEELLFRGFLMRFGVLASTLLFAAMHWGYGSIAEIILTFAAGLVLAMHVKKHGNVAPAIVAHALLNLTTIIVAFALSGKVQ